MWNEEVWKIVNEGIVSDQNNDKKEELDRTCVKSSASVKRRFGVFNINFQWSDARFLIVWRHKQRQKTLRCQPITNLSLVASFCFFSQKEKK